MGKKSEKFLRVVFSSLALSVLSSCAASSNTRLTDLERINRQQAATLDSLHQEVQRLNAELTRRMQTGTTIGGSGDLQKTKSDLEASLSSQVESGALSVSMEDKGVVVTVLDRVLFAPGRVELQAGALEALDKVFEVLQGEAQHHVVYVEGHTDNVPIHSSHWRSNWELSTARATEVIYYFEQKGLNPARLAATGYGEFHPVVSNDTPEGRMKNRRVEIVISPKTIGAA
jgi:chemotaxis protein MotB